MRPSPFETVEGIASAVRPGAASAVSRFSYTAEALSRSISKVMNCVEEGYMMRILFMMLIIMWLPFIS